MYRSMLAFCITLMAAGSIATAQIPNTISYQGILTDGAGNVVPDDVYRLTLKLYSVDMNGQASWTEVQDVSTVDGYFNVILGAKEPLRVLFNRQLWLGISVGMEMELAPRIKLTASAYSIRAQRADTANAAIHALEADDAQTVGGYSVSSTPGANRLLVLDGSGKFPSGAIPSVPAVVQDGSLTSVKIAAGEVVKSINTLHDDVELVAGSNVSIAPSGNTLIISATPGGGGGDITGVVATDGLAGGGTAGDVVVTIADQGVITQRLADGAVTDTKIADHAVVRSINNITDHAQLTAGANIAITPTGNTIMIEGTAGGDITAVDTPPGSGLTGGAATGDATLAIEDGGVTSAKLADAAVTPIKISSSTATSGQFLGFDGTNVGWADPVTGGSLDEAYDHGGSGVGRTITADAGAVTVGGTDGFLVTGTAGSGVIPIAGPGTRMMFYPKKAAFRAGRATGTEWDDGKTGIGSTALGIDSEASGTCSSAIGLSNVVTMQGATALGVSNNVTAEYAVAGGITNAVSGQSAIALGESNNASGIHSVAMGLVNSALGDNSVAMGAGNQATGEYSVAMGYTSAATAKYSVALGYSSSTGFAAISAGDNNDATGDWSVAMGNQTTASGDYATSFGRTTTASGENSCAIGFGALASGQSSIALGSGLEAEGTASIALGYLTWASGAYSTAMGQSTIASNYHSTAMGYSTTASGSTSLATGYSTTASGEKSTAMGSYVSTNGKLGSFIIGDASTTSVWTSALANQMKMRFAGGYQLYTNNTATTGVYMNGNTGGWINFSDRNMKENFTAVDGEQLLAKVRALPVTMWNYRDSDPSVRYIGPMAQDFWQAFHLGGTDSLGINSIAIDGVNLAAIKALEERTRQLREVTTKLEEAQKSALLTAYGEGRLEGGRAHIDLDPEYLRAVTIDAKHPMKVFIQLEDDCLGVFIAGKTSTGFDVVELQKGRSNARFSYKIVCARRVESPESLASLRVSSSAR